MRNGRTTSSPLTSTQPGLIGAVWKLMSVVWPFVNVLSIIASFLVYLQCEKFASLCSGTPIFWYRVLGSLSDTAAANALTP